MMRLRYILPLFALALFFGATFAAPSAHATACTSDAQCTSQQPPGQTCNVAAGVCGFAPDSSFQKCLASCTTGSSCVSDANGTYTCQAAVNSSTGSQAGADTPSTCQSDEVLDSSTGLCWPKDSAQGIIAAEQTEQDQQAQTQTQAQLNNLEAGSSVNGTQQPAAAKTPTLNGSAIDQSSDMLDWLMAELMSLFAWLLGIAAITLDNAMYYTVVHMGSYVNGLSAVGVAWRILRDIGNIVLIFGFVALGITVILDVNWYGGGTKMLPTLLIAALMLNFSLFAAEAVVDVGNLFATEFYTQINGGQPAAPKDWGSTSVSNEGISNAVMNQLGLQEFYNAGVSTGTNGSNVSAIFQTGHPFIIGFMAILIFMIASFVFFSLSFILIARFIVLIFLIIIAPIGFAGLAVPKLEGSAKEWWGTLFSQTITAPVMLLMLYVALAVITDTQFLTGFGLNGTGSGASDVAQNAWLGAVTTASGTSIGALASVLLSFLVAMGLLLAVTMLSKRLGAIGGAWATNLGAKATFGLTAASAGFVGRRTVGRLSNFTAQKIRSSSLGRLEVGRALAGVAERGGKSSFDMRGIKVASSSLKSAGIDVGKAAGKGGYAKIQKDATDERVKYAKTLELNSKEKAEKAALDERKKKNDERKAANTARLAQEKELLKQRISDAGDYAEAREEANRLYKQAEKEILDEAKEVKTEADAIQKGVVDPATGKKVQRGLDDLKNLPQERYAKNLSMPFANTIGAVGQGAALGAVSAAHLAVAGGPATIVGTGVGLTGAAAYYLSAAPAASKSAADKILKDLKKPQSEKDLDSIKKLLEKEGKEHKEEREEDKKEDAH